MMLDVEKVKNYFEIKNSFIKQISVSFNPSKSQNFAICVRECHNTYSLVSIVNEKFHASIIIVNC